MAQQQRKLPDIDVLAHRFIHRDYSFRGIVNKFGEELAGAAVRRMAATVMLIEPNNRRARAWAKAKG